MPYNIRKQKCKQSDGDAGSWVLSYTDKSGKKHRACHTSRKKAKGQIAAIEMRREGDAAESEGEVMIESLLREMVRELLRERTSNYGLANTVYSDLNEILMASALMGGASIEDVATTVGADAAATVRSRVGTIRDAVLGSGGTQEDLESRVRVELQNARNMAAAVEGWASSKDHGRVVRVYWTARPGVLQRALNDAGMGDDVVTPGHPADVAVLFDDGQVLGISAKATKGTADVAFKNPGWGTVASALGLDASIPRIETERQLQLIDPGAAAMPTSHRKQHLRASPERKSAADAGGRVVLRRMRDEILAGLEGMTEPQVRSFVLSNLMDAGSVVVPPYVKVTATGAGRSAHVSDPVDNPMIEMVRRGGLRVAPRGEDSILFLDARGTPILQLRAKWESQMLASSLKLSAEPASKRR